MRVVITIEGAQADVLEQEPDEQVQFSTDGEYTCVDGCGMLTYPESELTGMAGTLTTITFTPSNAVLKRTGTVTSRMVFCPRHAQHVFVPDAVRHEHGRTGDAALPLHARRARRRAGATVRCGF